MMKRKNTQARGSQRSVPDGLEGLQMLRHGSSCCEKAASGVDSSDEAGGRERKERRDEFPGSTSSALAFSSSQVDLLERTCLRPDWSDGTQPAEINGLTAECRKKTGKERERDGGQNKGWGYP